MLTGALTAVVVLAIIYAFAAMRPVPPIDTDFGDRKVSFTTSVPPDKVYKALADVMPGDAYKLGRADQTRGRVILHDAMSFRHFGFFYPVDVIRAADGSTQVTVGIKSKYPLQFGPIVRRQQEKQVQAFADKLKARIEGRPIAA